MEQPITCTSHEAYVCMRVDAPCTGQLFTQLKCLEPSAGIVGPLEASRHTASKAPGQTKIAPKFGVPPFLTAVFSSVCFFLFGLFSFFRLLNTVVARSVGSDTQQTERLGLFKECQPFRSPPKPIE